MTTSPFTSTRAWDRSTPARNHQIRVQMAHAGAPLGVVDHGEALLVDEVYVAVLVADEPAVLELGRGELAAVGQLFLDGGRRDRNARLERALHGKRPEHAERDERDGENNLNNGQNSVKSSHNFLQT